MQVLSLQKLQITNDKYLMVERLLSTENCGPSLTMIVAIHFAMHVQAL
jgi:hypothetical protein